MMVNKKWVKILKAARKSIESGEYEYVCHAIVDSKIGLFGLYNIYYTGAKMELVEEIDLRLGGYASISSWLCTKYYDLWESFEDDFTQYRLAWIDSMIEEFSGVSATIVKDGVYNEFTTL